MNITLLLDAQRARTADDFLIRDVPGTSGRLDVVCRILISTFRTVPPLAPSIQANAILGGPPNPSLRLQVQNVISGEFPESELACALILKALFHQYHRTAKESDVQWPQFLVTSQSFKETLNDIITPMTQLFYLTEKGVPLEEVDLNLNNPIVLILGDDQGLSSDHEKIIMQHTVQEVSMGTRSLLGSQVISLFLLELARRMQKNQNQL